MQGSLQPYSSNIQTSTPIYLMAGSPDTGAVATSQK
jgi:hypothetical protein